MSGPEQLPERLRNRYTPSPGIRRGAMGRVVQAHDRDLDRTVAIKIVDAPAAGDVVERQIYDRFRDEAQAAARITHPNVVKIHNVGQDETASWIEMEYVAGGTLRERMDRGEQLSQAQIVAIVSQLLDALAHCHDQKIVHHDIKPANILLTSAAPDAQVKLADFGIARTTSPMSGEAEDATMLAMPQGTPSYMAPEQLQGVTGDPRSDIWAVGVLLYELLAKKKPFKGDALDIASRVSRDAFVPPSKLSVLATPALDEVVRRALEPLPGNRFQTAGAFRQALQAATREDAAPAPARKRPSTMLIAGGALAVAVLLLVAWLGTRPLQPGGVMQAAAPPPVMPTAGPALAPPVPGPPPAAPATVQPIVVAAPTPPRAPVAPTPAPAPALLAPQAAMQPPPPPAPQLIPAVVRPRPEPFLLALPDLTRCSILRSETHDGGIILDGHVAARDQAAVNEAARLAGLDITWQAAVNQGEFCPIFDAVRGTMDSAAPRLAALQTRLREGDVVTLDIGMADWPGVINLWFVEHEGMAVQLLRDVRLQAGERRRMREMNGEAWEVGPPFGTDLMLLVVTAAPLPAALQQNRQPVAALAAGLEATIRRLRQQGQPVHSRAVFIEIGPR